MELSVQKRNKARKGRIMRVRKKLRGNSEKPRLCVFKSNCHLFVQLIDDVEGKTIFGIGTNSKANRTALSKSKPKESAKALGEQVAKKAKELNIQRIVFDRGRNRFHGIIKELAESARATGLQF